MREGEWKDYIPRDQFDGSAGEWLEQEYARQRRLGVVTGQHYVFGSAPNPLDDVLEAGAPFEIPAKGLA